MNLFYRLGSNIYVNVTNLCHCNCEFCIRGRGDGVGDADTLWLPREPTLAELKDAFLRRMESDKEPVAEIVFCGYGEPLERAEVVCELAGFIKARTGLPLRLNTNGLVRLISPGFDIGRLSVFDTVSISLNADTEEEYLRVTRPSFGIAAFGEMLAFAAGAAAHAKTQFTVVETLDAKRQENAKALAAGLGVPLIVRSLM